MRSEIPMESFNRAGNASSDVQPDFAIDARGVSHAVKPHSATIEAIASRMP
jgi:hypothetical protein